MSTNNLSKHILLEFYSDHCQYCNQQNTTLEQANPEDLEYLNLIQVDVNTYPQLANDAAISGVPTFILLENRYEVARTSGYHEISELQRFVHDNITEQHTEEYSSPEISSEHFIA